MLGLLVAATAAAAPLTLRSGDATLGIEPGGSLTLSINGTLWLAGGAFARDVAGRWRLHALTEPTRTSGTDVFGTWSGYNFSWTNGNGSASDASTPTWLTSVRAYTTGGRIVFRQEFPAGATGLTSRGAGELSAAAARDAGTGWPMLFTPEGSTLGLGMVEYVGSSAGNMASFSSRFPDGMAAPQDRNKGSGGPATGCVVIVPRPQGGPGAAAPLSHTLVFSQLHQFFGAALDVQNISAPWDSAAVVAAAYTGVAPGIDQVPAGWASESVLVLVSDTDEQTEAMFGMPPGGINHAVQRWGDTLLSYHGGKQRSAVGSSDADRASLRAKYFGYSTTAFYHHNPCDPGNVGAIPGCKSWEDTLMAVHDDLRARGIPYQWMLIDSYWYGESRYGGTYLWEDGAWLGTAGKNATAWPTRFNPGAAPLRRLAEYTKLKGFGAHAGAWNPATPYANVTGTEFPGGLGTWVRGTGGQGTCSAQGPDGEKSARFLCKDGARFPQDQKVWDHVLSKNSADWKLGVIKQDHISENPTVPNDPTAWDKWFDGMGMSAAKHNMNVFYCMAWASVLLNSVKLPAAEVSRASADYIAGHGGRPTPWGTASNGDWQIGPDAMFHWGVGILPYKDTFLSNSTEHSTHTERSLQPAANADAFNGREMQPTFHALMASLSGAYVTCSDGIRSANETELSRLYRADGLLLKPERPVTATDANLLESIFGDCLSWQRGCPPEEQRARQQHGAAAPASTAGPALLYSTISTVNSSAGLLRTSFVANMRLSAPFALLPAHIGLDKTGLGYVALPFNFHDNSMLGGGAKAIPFSADEPLMLSAQVNAMQFTPSLWIIAPRLQKSGVAVLGEIGKFISVAAQRVSSVEELGDGLASVGLKGVAGENVSFAFDVKGKTRVRTVVVGTNGTATVTSSHIAPTPEMDDDHHMRS